MATCIFCEIAAGRVPCRQIHGDDEFLAFHDVQPQAPPHVLVIPRRHIASTAALTPADEAMMGRLALLAARLAADILGIPTVLIARTDAFSAKLLTTEIDERDHPFIENNERLAEGFYAYRGGLEAAIARGVAYAPYCDVVWCETSEPSLEDARRFAEGIHKAHPGKLLAYNCSPSFNWKANLDDATIAKFQRELGAMGY